MGPGHIRGWGLGCLALYSCCYLSGCGGSKTPPTTPAPPLVTVAQPIVQEFTRFADYTGRVEAADSLEIRARVGGFLQSTYVQDGDVVNEGDPLFSIDPAPYEAVLKAREASVEKAKAALKLAEANIKRSTPLLRSGAIPAQEFDVLVAQQTQAAAELMGAEAALQSARLDVSYTRINAPFSGRLSDIKVSSGSLIAGGASATGTVLASLVSIRPAFVSFDLDEATFLRTRKVSQDGNPHAVRDQQIPVRVALGNSSDYSVDGVIDYVDPSLNAATASLRLRARFGNQDLRLVPGMFVRVRIALQRRADTMMLPVRAISMNQDRHFVFVLDGDGVVQYRPIEKGLEQDGMVVIEKGLSAEDRVVIDGLLRVKPGVKPETKPADLGSSADGTTATKARG